MKDAKRKERKVSRVEAVFSSYSMVQSGKLSEMKSTKDGICSNEVEEEEEACER